MPRNSKLGNSKLRFSHVVIAVRSLLLILGVGSVIVTTAGCQFAPQQPFSWPWGKEKEQKQPARILPVWTDTVLYQTNRPGVRGFGGRIYFYEEQKTEPIEVDGGLAVYVFDADNDEPHNQKPLRKFVFTSEQFAKHMSRTSIGPSFSVWLPWGEVGGPPLRLSLIARFEGSKGGTVISDPTIKLLPGVPENKQSSPTAERSGSTTSIQLASHSGGDTATSSGSNANDSTNSNTADGSDAPASGAAALPRRSVGTIDLPPSFQRHLFPTEQSAAGASKADSSPTQANLPLNPSDQPATATGQDSSDLSQLPASPSTTTVIDYRSRWKNSNSEPASYAGSRTKRDIRQGAWIESTH